MKRNTRREYQCNLRTIYEHLLREGLDKRTSILISLSLIERLLTEHDLTTKALITFLRKRC